MEFVQYPQDNCDAKIAEEIISLENTAWPDTESSEFPSAPDTYASSFVAFEKGKVVCHVGIRKSVLFHKGEEYMAYGLSEVVTHPCYQKRGIATETIRKASAFIVSQKPDISIFTCAKDKVGFYTNCGWKAVPGAHFIGGTSEKPFRSDELGLVTMMRFLSDKAIKNAKDFENADIVFELGEGQLW